MPGIYTMLFYVGTHPTSIESFDSFTFEKSSVGFDGSGSPGTVTLTDGEFTQTVSLKGSVIPQNTELLGHYPEPFNPQAKINFSLGSAEKVELTVYSLTGERVATLIDRTMEPGFYSEIFDGSNLSSGIYFYSLKAGSYQTTNKMVLMK